MLRLGEIENHAGQLHRVSRAGRILNTKERITHMAEDKAEIERLNNLAKNKDHIRKNALHAAGIYLQGSERDIINMLLEDIDEEVRKEGGDLYTAHEELIETIAAETVKIGEELSRQSKTITSVEEIPHEVVSQAINELLAKLPKGYISSHELAYDVTASTYHLVLLPTHTLLFKEARGQEAIERTTRYVAERERQPGLPVGVIDGIYD